MQYADPNLDLEMSSNDEEYEDDSERQLGESPRDPVPDIRVRAPIPHSSMASAATPLTERVRIIRELREENNGYALWKHAIWLQKT